MVVKKPKLQSEQLRGSRVGPLNSSSVWGSSKTIKMLRYLCNITLSHCSIHRCFSDFSMARATQNKLKSGLIMLAQIWRVVT